MKFIQKMAVAVVAVAATITMTPQAAQAGPAMYYLECVGGSYVSEKQSVTRLNVMGCAGGVLYLTNQDSGKMVAYNGYWCVLTGQAHRGWTGWQILNSGCRDF